MITFLYRWRIPSEHRAEFTQNWEELTREVQQRYGMHSATLYASGEDFVSITHWPTEEAWAQWKHELAGHPYRTKWRAYKVSEPETLTTAVHLGPVPKEPDS